MFMPQSLMHIHVSYLYVCMVCILEGDQNYASFSALTLVKFLVLAHFQLITLVSAKFLL